VYYFVASSASQVVGPFPDQQTCLKIRAEVEPRATCHRAGRAGDRRQALADAAALR
jgi:hypothetical protein